MTLGVRALATNGEGHVLLVKHTYVPGWHLPGGGVERGETAIDTLEKELFEETRCRLKQAPTLYGAYLNRNATKRDHVLLYDCGEVEIVEEHVPNREIVAVGYFPPDALPEDATAATVRRVNEWRSGGVVDRFW